MSTRRTSGTGRLRSLVLPFVSCTIVIALNLAVYHALCVIAGPEDSTLLLGAANALLNPTWIMKEIGRRFVNELRFGNHVNRSYDDQFVQAGAKVGLTVNARLPQRYRVNKGQALNPQAVVDSIVPITLTDQANIGIEFSMASLTMEVDNYREKCIAPAIDALVNVFDYDGLSRMYQEVANTVGTPGVTPGSTGTLPGAANDPYLDAGVKLSNLAAPMPRVAMISPNMHARLVSANSTVFNPSAQISKNYKSGRFGGEALGVSEWFQTQNIPTHTVGALGGTPLVNGATLSGATSIVSDGWSNSITGLLKKGDVIQLAGVYAINPLNYQSTTQLRDFVVTADVNSDSSGNATIPISPAIVSTGNFANVAALPANDAIITIFGHASSAAGDVTPQGLIYHEDAFAAVMADLELPGGVWVAERINNKALGVAIRFIKDYNIMTDQSPARLDILYGWKAVRPEMACRVCS